MEGEGVKAMGEGWGEIVDRGVIKYSLPPVVNNE